ncbi:hypothetical protein [Wielerella bovis]|uniref:hypothetical protein n=1 Tax=Wielerella bovis TaxID=2917790 RepID=UPI002018BD7B|nr:hypothetical protein [Wielerella bovis]ULJ60543.1 hypothetical protein MIS44_01295 [Wielerella bovis]
MKNKPLDFFIKTGDNFALQIWRSDKHRSAFLCTSKGYWQFGREIDFSEKIAKFKAKMQVRLNT